MTDKEHTRIPLLRLDFNEDDVKFVQNGIAEILRSGYWTMDSKVKRCENLYLSKPYGSRHITLQSNPCSRGR